MDTSNPLIVLGSAVLQRGFASNWKEVEEGSSLFLDVVLTRWTEPGAEGGSPEFEHCVTSDRSRLLPWDECKPADTRAIGSV